MRKIYDDWVKLVDAVVCRERLREIARCPSRESSSSSISIGSSHFSLDFNISHGTCASFSSISLVSDSDEQSLVNDNGLPIDPPSSASYEELPDFTDVHFSKAPELFIKKIKMCCVIFDFTNPVKNLKEKEIKRQTLLQLVDYVTPANVKFTEVAMQEVVKMVSVNIFRDHTPQPRGNKLTHAASFKDDDTRNPSWPHWKLVVDHALGEVEQIAFDPAWPHLQLVYDFFLRSVDSVQTDAKDAKNYLDPHFIQRLIDLFDSEDPRERKYLKFIVHSIYRKFMVHRPFIRKAINDAFYHFVYDTEKHNGIAEFLEIVGSIIRGFKLPLREEHIVYLVRILISLHKPKCLATYHEQLSYCIVELLKKDCKLVCLVINGLIRYWPGTNSLKEIMFLGELEQVLEVTQETEFKQCITPLFSQISRCLSSSHSRVAEKAFLYWNNEYTKNLIKQNSQAILPIIFPALKRTTRYHWDSDVRSLALEILDFYYNLDWRIFNSCQIKFKDDESKQYEIEDKRAVTWKRLEELAAEQPATKEVYLLHQNRYPSIPSQKLMVCEETSEGQEDRPIPPCKSRQADMEFEIDTRLLTTKKDLEKELKRSQSKIHNLQLTNSELHASNKITKEELERSVSEIHDLQIINEELRLWKSVLEVRNKFFEKQLERKKYEVHDLQTTNKELSTRNDVIAATNNVLEKQLEESKSEIQHLHKSNKVIEEKLERCKITLSLMLFVLLITIAKHML